MVPSPTDMASSTGSDVSPLGPPPSTPRKLPTIPTLEVEEEKSWANRRKSRSDPRRFSVIQNLSSIDTRLSLEKTAADNTLLPLLSPVAQMEQMTPDKPYLPGQPKSLEGIALRSFCLGGAVALSAVAMVLVLALTSSPLWRLPFFIGTLATFHFLEFWTTAKYNTPAATISAFLLTANWPAYAIAHTAASLECLVTRLAFPGWHWGLPAYAAHVVTLAGFVLVGVGQLIRSTAMVQAGHSFNHIVQQRKRDGHSLVTTGIYGTLRHPSYFGFFWWSIGTQLVLGNSACLVAYAVVLWRFFSSRIRREEVHLVEFFKADYEDYRKKVPTRIPFIR